MLANFEATKISLKTMQFSSPTGVSGYFEQQGTGEKVVLVHGFTADGRSLERIANILSERYDVLVPDMPGTERSDLTPNGWELEDFAKWLKDLTLEVWNGEPFSFFGHSMGGYIGLAYAEMFPKDLKAFGLILSRVFEDGEEKKAGRRKLIDFVERNGAEPIVRDLYKLIFNDSFRTEHPDVIEFFVETAKRFPKEGIMRAAEAMLNRPGRARVWEELECPKLLLAGAEDKLIDRETNLRQASLSDNSLVLIEENMSHMGIVEEPERVAEIIDRFLVQSLIDRD